jgi:hypothetical protein
MRISCGENDCLKDDSIRFLNKALRSGHQDVKLKIYKYLLHGYLVKKKKYIFIKILIKVTIYYMKRNKNLKNQKFSKKNYSRIIFFEIIIFTLILNIFSQISIIFL